jgi:NAD(P)-dependent dehydrogenase (short-subunit alcohol dehydrogenase family)
MPACISPQSFEADEVVEMTLEEWDRILAVNLTGVFLHHSREAVRAMIPNKSGAHLCIMGDSPKRNKS